MLARNGPENLDPKNRTGILTPRPSINQGKMQAGTHGFISPKKNTFLRIFQQKPSLALKKRFFSPGRDLNMRQTTIQGTCGSCIHYVNGICTRYYIRLPPDATPCRHYRHNVKPSLGR